MKLDFTILQLDLEFYALQVLLESFLSKANETRLSSGKYTYHVNPLWPAFPGIPGIIILSCIKYRNLVLLYCGLYIEIVENLQNSIPLSIQNNNTKYK